MFDPYVHNGGYITSQVGQTIANTGHITTRSLSNIGGLTAAAGICSLTYGGLAQNYTVSSTNVPEILVINGDLFKGNQDHDQSQGLFARLQRLEQMMGIMPRDRYLEAKYEPMQLLGDAYDEAVDAAITAVLAQTHGRLAAIEQQYQQLKEEAKVWIALQKD